MPRIAAAPLHFGPPSDALFGWYHRATGAVDRQCGVVLCNPIGDDYVRAHRTLRHLAERLASEGFDVLRFDFRGTGDSSGDERDTDRVAAWLEDVGLAIAELRVQSGVTKVALVGLRMGATIAAAAAARSGGVDSAVLWGAYETGAAFAAESVRTHKMHKMLEPQSFAAGPTSYPEGDEALGFFLSNETARALKGIDLRSLGEAPAPSMLVIGVGNTPAELPLVEHFSALGASVDQKHLPGHKFLIAIPHRSAVPTEVIDEIAAWLSEKYPAAAAPPRPSANGKTASPAHVVRSNRAQGATPAVVLDELPVVFGGERRLFGVLTSPPAQNRKASRPCIIMLNAGCVHRIGPHRLFVRMARAWAERGFYVFRMDLSGIGDSPMGEGCEENLCYPLSGQRDCQDAMAALRGKIGVERFILTGLCSGADIAFQLGYQDSRVAGVVMMNPRTFCVHDLSMVEAYKDGRYYQDSFFRKESWLKLLRGQVDLRRVVKTVAPKAKSEVIKRVRGLVDRARKHASETSALTDHNDVPGCLQSMAVRGVDTMLLATVHDPGVDYVDVHFKKAMQGLTELASFRRLDLEGTDHTFTSLWSQEHVCAQITDHLIRKHLG